MNGCSAVMWQWGGVVVWCAGYQEESVNGCGRVIWQWCDILVGAVPGESVDRCSVVMWQSRVTVVGRVPGECGWVQCGYEAMVCQCGRRDVRRRVWTGAMWLCDSGVVL